MKDKIKKVIKKHEVLHENGTYWDEKLLKQNIKNMYNELFSLYVIVKSLNLEVKPTFEEWLNVNFTKYNKEYYQDSGRNGIWKKHQLYELYEDISVYPTI